MHVTQKFILLTAPAALLTIKSFSCALYEIPSIPGHNRIAFTHRDVGYEDNAGAVIFPWLLAEYLPSLDIKKPRSIANGSGLFETI